MKAVMSTYLMLIVFLVLLSAVHVTETFVSNNVFDGVDVVALSDADRRALTRAIAAQKRAIDLNRLSTLTVKVPPNCFDTRDAGYNTSACRSSRNAREIEISKLAGQAGVAFCASRADCKQAQRTSYIQNDYTTVCQAQIASKLRDNAFLTQLMTKDNTFWLQLPNSDLVDTPTKTLVAQLPFLGNTVNDVLQELGAAWPSLTSSTALTNIVRIDFHAKQASMYSDILISYNLLKAIPDGSVAILVRKLGVGDRKVPDAVSDALQNNDAWLDRYFYFQDTMPGEKIDADRLQKCGELLSKDELVKLGAAAYDVQNAKTNAKLTSSQAQASSVITVPVSVLQLVADYMSQRKQRVYPKTWYLSWQALFSEQHASAQRQYNTNLLVLASVPHNKLAAAYITQKTLLDNATAANDALKLTLDKFDGGTYLSVPYCFLPGTETRNTDLDCCVLSTTKIVPFPASVSYKQYCPEPSSLCARVASTAGPDSVTFRACKNFFANQIKINQINAEIDKLKADPATSSLIASYENAQIANSGLLKDIGALQQSLTQVALDLQAAI